MPFSQKFPNADPLGLKLLERLIAFDPKDRPAAEEVRALYVHALLSSFFSTPSILLPPLFFQYKIIP